MPLLSIIPLTALVYLTTSLPLSNNAVSLTETRILTVTSIAPKNFLWPRQTWVDPIWTPTPVVPVWSDPPVPVWTEPAVPAPSPPVWTPAWSEPVGSWAPTPTNADSVFPTESAVSKGKKDKTPLKTWIVALLGFFGIFVLALMIAAVGSCYFRSRKRKNAPVRRDGAGNCV